jgi:hypothetical protein
MDNREEVPSGVALALRRAEALFIARNDIYGSAYKRGGEVMMALFPPGGIPAITKPEDALRLRLIQMCASKLQRYAHSFARGGHVDSARDLVVFAAMLEEATTNYPMGDEPR